MTEQMRNRVGKAKGRKKRKNRGSITVFVTLMMVPVVAITGVMVDVSRLKLYRSQAAMAADAYGDAVLSEFDNLLKELYGLFSITQNQEGLESLKTLEEYASYAFVPNGDEKGLAGFMPYQDSDVKISYEKVEGASLSNNNVLMTQISDFMRFRVVEEVLEEGGILDTLSQFNTLDPTMEAMEERKKITDSSKKALGKIQEYYEELKKLKEYPNFLSGCKTRYESYSGLLGQTVKSDEYEDYVYYLEHKEEIDSIIEEFEEEEDSEEETGDSGTEEEEESKSEEEKEEERKKQEIYERFKDFDADEYKKNLKKAFDIASDLAQSTDSEPIDFGNADNVINKLGQLADQLEDVLRRLEEQVKTLEEKVEKCDDNVSEEMKEEMKDFKKEMKEEIRDLKDILKLSKDFKDTYNRIETIHNDIKKNKENKQLLEDKIKALDKINKEIVEGKIEPNKVEWSLSIGFDWYDFMDEKAAFYQDLKKICEGEDGGAGDKKAGDKQIDKAESAQAEAEKQFDIPEVSTARDITGNLASQLKSSGVSSSEVPKLTDYFSGGLSFDALSSAGSHVLDKFLMTTYDFGMFSSRVTGIEPQKESSEEEGQTGITLPELPSGKDEEEYVDYSLTGIKMSPDVNYLYGAELEYLFGGHNKSVSNLNETRNIICGVRLTMNFLSTYRISQINKAIKAIAAEAAAAVSASGVGAAAAPLVRVAVSGALRMAVASIEMAQDWNCLRNREDVIFLKDDLKDLKSAEIISTLLNVDLSNSSNSSSSSKKKVKIKLSYEDYMYVLLCLFIDENTLLSRTQNLITLNVNQAMNKQDVLSQLSFKMEDTVTAVKSTCKIKSDFVIVPDYIMEWYYSGTDMNVKIRNLEEEYFGYSVIRGY